MTLMANTSAPPQIVASQCVDELLKRRANISPFFVVITGDSGSGKSYYSELIKQELEERHVPFSYINADDFLISRADREPMKHDFYREGEFAGKSKWEIFENMFRLSEFQRIVSEIKLKREARYKPYMRERGVVSEEDTIVQPSDVIIVDSSMLVELMDFVILVDVDMETIIRRKVVRDSDVRTPAQIEEMHRKVQGYYWARRKPIKADIVINNNDIRTPKVAIQGTTL